MNLILLKQDHTLYAPNGTMKTSFAKTLIDYTKDQKPEILPFPDIASKLSITDENEDQIEPKNIFVIKSEVSNFSTEKMSTLLVKKELREKYLSITKRIDDIKKILIEKLQEISGIKNTPKNPDNLELTLTKDIINSANKNLFMEALEYQKNRVEQSKKEFLHINYNILFNNKTEDIFKTKDFMSQLKSYVSTFDKLISSSIFFKKGEFNHINADTITKQLIDNGFFKAKHKVTINTRTGVKTIETENDLKTAIEEEKSLILNNDDLKKSFESFSKILKKNEDTRKLAKYLEENPDIIEHLNERQKFKKNIWASFIKETESVYNEVIKISSQVQPELKKIQKQARKESSKWEDAVKIFKNRFSVPFEITIDNKTDIILEGETVPVLSFKYIDKHTSATIPIPKDTLYKTLSTGEQRALYILDIIFEIEARKELKIKTFFIFDDIADSFDYKNKYAIIQYLYELQSYPNSYQIILTHNFDFFRTIVSRLDIKRKYALHPEITSDKVILKEMLYQKGPFKVWKNKLDKNKIILIASIPFMRNIAEYCSMEEYKKLTALLHINPEIFQNTNDITIKDLEEIIKVILKKNDEKFTLNQFNYNDKVKDIIYQTADLISQESKDNYLLENKIVLSIAIRLKTEEFILNTLKEIKKDIKKFLSSQTLNLIRNYQEHFRDKNKETLTRVQLITPENIHLNAFMYEPILDTGYELLVNLYNDVKNLN